MALDKTKALDEGMYKGAGSLKADDLDGANATVITVEDIDSMTFDDEDAPGGEREVIILKSREYDKGFFLNKSGTRAIVEQYGDVPNKWIGKKVPLIIVRTNNPKTKKQIDSLQVAAADAWERTLNGFRRHASRTATPKRAAKKAKRRR